MVKDSSGKVNRAMGMPAKAAKYDALVLQYSSLARLPCSALALINGRSLEAVAAGLPLGSGREHGPAARFMRAAGHGLRGHSGPT
jgi:hypothetical protein